MAEVSRTKQAMAKASKQASKQANRRAASRGKLGGKAGGRDAGAGMRGVAEEDERQEEPEAGASSQEGSVKKQQRGKQLKKPLAAAAAASGKEESLDGKTGKQSTSVSGKGYSAATRVIPGAPALGSGSAVPGAAAPVPRTQALSAVARGVAAANSAAISAAKASTSRNSRSSGSSNGAAHAGSTNKAQTSAADASGQSQEAGGIIIDKLLAATITGSRPCGSVLDESANEPSNESPLVVELERKRAATRAAQQAAAGARWVGDEYAYGELQLEEENCTEQEEEEGLCFHQADDDDELEGGAYLQCWWHALLARQETALRVGFVVLCDSNAWDS